MEIHMSDSKRRLNEAAPTPSGGRLTVFSIKQSTNGSVWVKAGSAWVNRDGSMNVFLDVLPLDGKLHIRPSDATDAAG
jgi:hypothetical protein